MRQKLPTLVKLVALLAVMPISGIVAVILVAFVLMGIGLWLEDNGELLFGGSKGIVIVAGTFAVGALAPLLLLWRWLGDE
ncbi:MAG TPA: hypothetical protein PLF81_10700 [Candidatus Anammoximicrobium sp.]|nr:hypothetical protein [Candidatus Anammoximicrobium sp.]